MRSLSFPKLIVGSETRDRQTLFTNMSNSSDVGPFSHSRDSSSASDSPVTPTFSGREHARFPSSSSSLASTPPNFEPSDSPTNVSKTVLHDLVEDPGERDDEYDHDHGRRCSCEAHPFETYYPNNPLRISRPSLDYDLADGFCSDGEDSLRSLKKRRGSGDSPSPVANLASRIGNRLPSLSRRLKDRSPTSAVSRPGVRSAPMSRTPSFRLSSLTKALSSNVEHRDMFTPPDTPIDPVEHDLTPQAAPAPPIDITLPRIEDPIDRQALASTPLLPPTMLERPDSETESIQSPLQSPTVVGNPHTFSFVASPGSTPILQAVPSPQLSSKPSVASFGMKRSSQSMADIPPLAMTGSVDPWAAKLGHANFDIFPEPYMPGTCDIVTCKRLVEDWESARRKYLKHASHTSEHYGPTSQVYKMTEQKWTDIDAKWKGNHELAVSRAEANGECPVFQPLAESAPLTKMPTIDGPESMGKFPTLEEAGIVGPMVQYAKIASPPSKRSTLLKLFGDLRLSTGRTRSSS